MQEINITKPNEFLNNWLNNLKKEHEEEKILGAKYEKESLDCLKQGRIDECLINLKKISDYSIKNKVCKKIVDTCAKEGKFEFVKKIIFEVSSNHSPVADCRNQNEIWEHVSLTFATQNYIEEAIESIGLISNDYSKYDDSEFSTSHRSSAWKRLIEVLIQQKKFSEADKHLWHLDNESRYSLEKKVKIGLGTWVEPKSVSQKRYWSRELHKELTLEEATQEIIKQYADKRAYKEMDISDRPMDKDLNSDQMWAWKDKKRAEVEETKKRLANEFYQLPFEKQSEILKQFIKNSDWDFEGEEKLTNILSYLKAGK